MIIFDLDGTLADCEHRRRFVDPDKNPDYEYGVPPKSRGSIGILSYFHKETGNPWKPDWNAFYESCDKDLPIDPAIDLLRSVIEHGNVVEIWTGRCESVREKTEEWLLDNIFLFGFPFEILTRMRPVCDYTPDDSLKEKWLDETLSKGREIYYVVDDRKKVIDMWIRRGIFVLDVSQGNGDF